MSSRPAAVPLPAVFDIRPGMPPPGPDTVTNVGNKAFNLMRLTALGFPVPPGFVLPTAWCVRYLAEPEATMADLRPVVRASVKNLEHASGLLFGDSHHPLLVSVRSGAAASMPGMLETVLNVGLTRAAVDGILRWTGNPRLAWDTYRRFIQSFGEVVLGSEPRVFAEAEARALRRAGAGMAFELSSAQLRALTEETRSLAERAAGAGFPQDPDEQLLRAIEAVFRSWSAPHALEYRRVNGLEGLAGTAVTVQQMVFGNAGPSSGSGVAFTRNPASGENQIYVDFVLDGQGEDVVGGRVRVAAAHALDTVLPATFAELQALGRKLEAEFRAVQDVEFTVQEGRLFLLQTRDAKLSSWAALQTAVDMVTAGTITAETALHRLEAIDLDRVVRTRIEDFSGLTPVAQAVSAGVGIASGRMALSAARAQDYAGAGDRVILVREDLSAEDFAGLRVSAGILTARGGRTSHFAVVARDLNKVCLVGCTLLAIDADERACAFGNVHVREGDVLTLRGDDGAVYLGSATVLEERPVEALRHVAAWKSAHAEVTHG